MVGYKNLLKHEMLGIVLKILLDNMDFLCKKFLLAFFEGNRKKYRNVNFWKTVWEFWNLSPPSDPISGVLRIFVDECAKV